MHIRRISAVAIGLAAPLIFLVTAPAAAVPIVPGAGSGVADAEQITMTLTLAGASASSVDAYANAVATPGSPSYHKILSLQQARTRFGASPQRVARVSAWARSAGFTVVGLDATGTRLTVTGTARAAKAAFNVGLRHSVRDGVNVRSVTGTFRLPPIVAADVAAVTGLTQQVARPLHVRPVTPATGRGAACLSQQTPSDFSRTMFCLARPVTSAPAAAAQDGTFCSTYWAQWNNGAVPQKYPAGQQSNQVCGYSGPQLRSLYGLSAADTGAGQTIVVVGAYNNPSTLADANATFAANGVPPLPPGQYQVKTYATGGGSTDCDQDSWNLEQALDVQTVHTIAPAARIVYAAAPDCTQLEETLAQVITDTSLNATIVSNSWGILAEPTDTAYLTATNSTLSRAAILGIGTYFASGDYGDTTSIGGQATNVAFPASSPWVTAVGGTTSAIGATNQTLWQTGWEDAGNALTGGAWKRLDPAFVGGAGGGSSSHFTKPTWQKNTPGTKRAVPDIAALADPYTGFFIGASIDGQYQSGPVGGTSLATPVVASLAAIAQANAGADTDIGFLAPVLYAKATAGKTTTADVKHVAAGIWTPGISADLPRGDYLIDADAGVESLKTTSGYDTVTGLGTPGRTFLTDIVS